MIIKAEDALIICILKRTMSVIWRHAIFGEFPYLSLILVSQSFGEFNTYKQVWIYGEFNTYKQVWIYGDPTDGDLNFKHDVRHDIIIPTFFFSVHSMARSIKGEKEV